MTAVIPEHRRQSQSLSHTMLSMVRFCRANKIAVYDMSSKFSSVGRKHVAEFRNVFLIGEGIASGKHVAQTADQSAQT